MPGLRRGVAHTDRQDGGPAHQAGGARRGGGLQLRRITAWHVQPLLHGRARGRAGEDQGWQEPGTRQSGQRPAEAAEPARQAPPPGPRQQVVVRCRRACLLEDSGDSGDPEEGQATVGAVLLPPYQPAEQHQQAGGAAGPREAAALARVQREAQPQPSRLQTRSLHHEPDRPDHPADLRRLRAEETSQGSASPPGLRSRLRPSLEGGPLLQDGAAGCPWLCHPLDQGPALRPPR